MNVKKIVTLALCSALLLSTGVQVEAKDYYKKDFGFPAEGYEPYESMQEQMESLSLDNGGVDNIQKVSSKRDFNRDGKDEKLELCVKALKKADKAKMTIKLNNKLVASKKTTAGDYELSTYQLSGKTIVVLQWGWDQKYAGVVYEWKGNKFKEMKSLAKEHLRFCVAKEKSTEKEVFYIEYSKQLYNTYGRKWPKKVLKKYKKYAKRKSISATHITYEKYAYQENRLKKIGTDNYYYVSNAYE